MDFFSAQSTTAIAPDAPRIDAVEIERLRSSLGEESDAIIQLFLEETAKRLARMGRAMDPGERELLSREAHSLKSAAATFGCRHLAELARDLEDVAPTIALAPLAARLSALGDAYHEVREALLGKSS